MRECSGSLDRKSNVVQSRTKIRESCLSGLSQICPYFFRLFRCVSRFSMTRDKRWCCCSDGIVAIALNHICVIQRENCIRHIWGYHFLGSFAVYPSSERLTEPGNRRKFTQLHQETLLPQKHNTMLNSIFKKETPKEAAMKAKRETKKEVRVRSKIMICSTLFLVI